MKLSIIIVTHNTKDLLLKCIKSIKQNINNSDYEIIVVDNGSIDNTLDLLKQKFPEIKTVRNEKSVGFGKGNNQGIKLAKGEYIFITEPDTELITKNGIDILIEYFKKNKDVAVAAPQLILKKNNEIQKSVFHKFPDIFTLICEWFPINNIINKLFPKLNHIGKYYMNLDNIDNSILVKWVMGGIILIKKNIFDELNGFDEKIFLLFEDTDLFHRIKKKGYKVLYVPEVKVFHYWGANQENIRFMLDNYYKSGIYYFKKHYNKFYSKLFILITFLGSVFFVLINKLLIKMYSNKKTYLIEKTKFHKGWIKLIWEKF